MSLQEVAYTFLQLNDEQECPAVADKPARRESMPNGEEIMTLAFFVLTQYRCETDRRTDTLLSQRAALA